MRGRPCSCAFTGHRPGKLPWGEDESDLRCIALKAKLRAAVESAIHEGMEHFICGMAEGCDLYFAETVLALKSTYPHITLEGHGMAASSVMCGYVLFSASTVSAK